ncbi:MAG: M20/M25/M40 family metallo-hydrolase [Lentisphaeria bacterium]|nr:M20/M25/M40 family metallo-hydrolase [Lentisphaeria bacterium]
MIDKGFVPKKTILIIDGGFGSIAYAQKGIISVQLKAVGRGGHASVPWRFENPIEKLLDGYLRLRSAWVQPDEIHFWRNSMAPTVISGGAVTNQIPDEAEMILNIRYTKLDDFDKIMSLLKEKSGLQVNLLRQSDPVEMAPDHPELLQLKNSYENILQKPVKVERICGASDARHCAKLGLPVLIIGLDGGGVHAADEYCRLASIDTIHDVLMRYMNAPR